MKRRIKAVAAMAATASGIVGVSMSAAPAASAASRAGAAPAVTVVASGLNGPKTLAFGPGGLYVAESGTGGSSCVTADGINLCEGNTAAVLRIGPSGTSTVLSGLPSFVNPTEGAGGPAAVTFYDGRLAVLFQDTAVNPDGTTSVQGPGSDDFGKLVLTGPSGQVLGPDFAAFAAANPQDPATLGGFPGSETVYDSDPYDIVPYRGGYAVADAAANDVLWVSQSGHISVLARLPAMPAVFEGTTYDQQSVPTSLAVGPDGDLYVGTFAGAPSAPGSAVIYRLAPGHAPTVAVSGLTTVAAIAFDHEGRLLAVEYSTGGLEAPAGTPGALVRANVTTGAVTTLPVSGIVEPAGLAVASDGAVYVSNLTNEAGSGEVLRITGLG